MKLLGLEKQLSIQALISEYPVMLFYRGGDRVLLGRAHMACAA